MNWKYFFWLIRFIPFSLILYFQGKKLLSSVPKLPEAKGPKGNVDGGFKKTLNLLTIGESTVAGVGAATHQEAFTGTLAEELSSKLRVNVVWNVFAKSGFKTKKIIKEIVPKIESIEPDLIVVGVGANDAFQINSSCGWKKDTHDLMAKLKEKFPTATISFLNIPPIKDFPAFPFLIKYFIGNLAEIFLEDLKEVVSNHPTVFFNDELITFKKWSKRYGMEEEKVSKYFSDGVHPSVFTYQIWAKDFSNYLLTKTPISNYFK